MWETCRDKRNIVIYIQLAQSRCSNVVSTFAERLDNVVIKRCVNDFCELVETC